MFHIDKHARSILPEGSIFNLGPWCRLPNSLKDQILGRDSGIIVSDLSGASTSCPVVWGVLYHRSLPVNAKAQRLPKLPRASIKNIKERHVISGISYVFLSSWRLIQCVFLLVQHAFNQTGRSHDSKGHLCYQPVFGESAVPPDHKIIPDDQESPGQCGGAVKQNGSSLLVKPTRRHSRAWTTSHWRFYSLRCVALWINHSTQIFRIGRVKIL